MSNRKNKWLNRIKNKAEAEKTNRIHTVLGELSTGSPKQHQSNSIEHMTLLLCCMLLLVSFSFAHSQLDNIALRNENHVLKMQLYVVEKKDPFDNFQEVSLDIYQPLPDLNKAVEQDVPELPPPFTSI